MLIVSLLLMLFLFVLPTEIHAYLDPGSGSYAIQVIIGFMVGGLYIGKKYLKQITLWIGDFFKLNKKDEVKED